MNVKDTVFATMEWNYLARDKAQWLVIFCMVMSLWVSEKAEHFLIN
jgi:hypothetical protein